MYPAAKQPRRSISGCLAARSGASIRRVRSRRLSLRERLPTSFPRSRHSHRRAPLWQSEWRAVHHDRRGCGRGHIWPEAWVELFRRNDGERARRSVPDLIIKMGQILAFTPKTVAAKTPTIGAANYILVSEHRSRAAASQRPERVQRRVYGSVKAVPAPRLVADCFQVKVCSTFAQAGECFHCKNRRDSHRRSPVIASQRREFVS